jgi:hypothetical protein
MPKKRSKPPKPISEKQRAEDEKLREELRNADLKRFDEAMGKMMKPISPKTESRS